MTTALRLLLVEDSATDAELVLIELGRQGFEVDHERVDHAEGLTAALEQGGFDFVLCDHNLPGFDSSSALELVRSSDPELPFVVLSGTIGEEAAVAALKGGARDVVLKSNLFRLGSIVERELGEAADRRRLRAAEEETERLEEQLRQAQKMEAIGSLAGGIAHDFNNLLLAIRGYSALVLERAGEEKTREYVRQIDRAAAHGAELTRALLAYSRQQVLTPETTQLNDVVEETLAILDRLIGADIEVRRDLDPELPTIVVDRGQVGQVVLNLAVNGREAMPQGGTLLVRTRLAELDEVATRPHPEVAPGRYVLLEVTDSGIGMDHVTVDRVFDPYFTTKDHGTGLGLSTVYGVVRQNGGHVWLYSEPGLGTTFKVYFPASLVAARPRPSRPAPSSLTGSETILVVEDAELVRELVAEVLEGYGYTVLTARNGVEALGVFDQHGGVDVVLTDVVMPEMNGRELAERLRASRPSLKVLFSSGYPADGAIRQGIAEVSIAFIQKPYLADELARTIRVLLDD